MQHHDIFEIIVQMNIDYLAATLDTLPNKGVMEAIGSLLNHKNLY